MTSATAVTSPSLALVKYWGKQDGGVNLPATPSLAVTLGGLTTTTTARFTEDTEDRIEIGGVLQPANAFAPVLAAFRHAAGQVDGHRVHVSSANSFPTAAGIASSSSGYAALVLALDALHGSRLPPGTLSSIARIGSGSASRAIWGGFTVWREGSDSAEPLAPAEHWPDLRIVVAVVSAETKPVSSRGGMTHSRETSPVYAGWVASSPSLFDEAVSALLGRDLDALGSAMRASYLHMFATMFTARPPVFYWQPESVALIRLADELRARGVPVWETMDAGPQVKLLTVAAHVGTVVAEIAARLPGVQALTARPGNDPVVTRGEDRDA